MIVQGGEVWRSLPTSTAIVISVCPKDGQLVKYAGFPRLVGLLLCLSLAFPASAEIVSLAVKDKVREQYGAAGVARLERWEAMVWANVYQPTMVKLKAVNDFFNKMKFETDMQHWHKQDYWATPFETLASNGGDYPDDGEPLVLDILMPQMLPASKRTDLVPVYSFNAEGLWEARTHGKELRLGSATDITMWRDLELRMGVGQL